MQLWELPGTIVDPQNICKPFEIVQSLALLSSLVYLFKVFSFKNPFDTDSLWELYFLYNIFSPFY